MKKITTTLVLASFLALFLIISVSAATSSMTEVSGTVYNSSTSPLNNSLVTVKCGNLSASTTTDALGDYIVYFDSSLCGKTITINSPTGKLANSNATIEATFPTTLSVQVTASYTGLKNQTKNGYILACSNVGCEYSSKVDFTLDNKTLNSTAPTTNCFYNITDSKGTVVKDTSITCGVDSQSSQMLSDGNYTLNAFSNDSLGNTATASSNFSVSLPISPSVIVTINSPLSKTYTSHNIGINISYSGSPGLDYCSYNITDSTGKTIVNDTNMSCSLDSTSSQTLPNGKYILYAFANNTLKNLNTTAMVSFIVSVSSGGGGGGGGAVYPGTCITQWNCTAWSACLGGTETRTCSYPTGYCTPTTAEPATSQTCTAPAESQANTTAGTTSGSSSPITGGVIGALGGTQGILAIILLIAVIALALFFSSRKKKENLETEAGK